VIVRAAVLNAPKTPFSVEELELGPPKSGEVLVRMAATGVCHSDWHLVTGATKHPMPVVPGHEGAGVVEVLGDGVSSLNVGDHVALNWAPSCGACFYCRHGRPSLCERYVEAVWAGVMLDGTTRLSRDGKPVYHFSSLACFAERVVVPEICCVPVSKKLPLKIAAIIGCAVTTGVGAVLNTAQVAAGSSVVVFGAGGVGLSIVLGAKLAGASTIIVVDRTPEKLAIAREFGATQALLATAELVQQIRALTEGRGADYVFEAVGIPAVQEACLAAARPGGKIVFAGIAPMGSSTNLPGAILTRQEKTVMGSYYGTADPARDFPRFGDLYLGGLLDLDRLVSKTYRLDQINEAYADMLEGKLARGLVVFD
jgi:S-(hydroxymethyl)glutathione dehydrogenase/alcohol dehydrogenase